MYLEAVLLKALEILGSLRISPQERSLPVIGCVVFLQKDCCSLVLRYW
jgi:hypothetical protein